MRKKRLRDERNRREIQKRERERERERGRQKVYVSLVMKDVIYKCTHNLNCNS